MAIYTTCPRDVKSIVTRTIDYIDAINKAKSDAISQNMQYVDLNSGKQHKAVNSGKNPTLVSCCNAMRRCMLVKDELIRNPKTKSGFSSELEIRYYVNDLDLRECLFPLKARGRKKGMPYKTDRTHDLKLKNQFEDWLSRNNLAYSSDKKRDKYMVAGEYGAWQIHVHYFGTLETLFQTIYISIYQTKLKNIQY